MIIGRLFKRIADTVRNEIRGQLFYELYVAGKPESPEEFQKRVDYMTYKIVMPVIRIIKQEMDDLSDN